MAPTLQWRRGKAAASASGQDVQKSTRCLAKRTGTADDNGATSLPLSDDTGVRPPTVVASTPCEQQQKRRTQKKRAQEAMRPTDLTALDMRAVVQANVLCFDTQEGEFSGWIHVAEVPRAAASGNNSSGGGVNARDLADDATARKVRRRLVFRRRFCRLRELMCAFYESDAPSCAPIDRHVIISVERVHERNKAFQFVDYEDRCIMLFTTLGADFEEWFDAFAYAVRKTQVSKSPIDGHDAPAQSNVKPSRHRSREGTAHTGGGGYLSKKSPQDPGCGEDDDESDERTHTAWLYLQCPWWKLHHRRRRSRRYFALSGVTLSCFGVNKEGQLAEFTTKVASIKHDAAKDPLMVQVMCEVGKTLRLSQKASKARVMEEWVDRLRAALDNNSSRPVAVQ